MNTNIQGGFQICIRVALKEREERLMRKKKKKSFLSFLKSIQLPKIVSVLRVRF